MDKDKVVQAYINQQCDEIIMGRPVEDFSTYDGISNIVSSLEKLLRDVKVIESAFEAYNNRFDIYK